MSNRDYLRIEQAIRYLAEHAHEQPHLEHVAAHVGLSEFHFQRLFRRWAGVSPKRFLQFLTATHARALLQSSRSALDVSIEAGLSSPGRLHDLMVAIHAATPGDIKSGGAGLAIRYGVHDTQFGKCFVATTERGVCALEFISPTEQVQSLKRLTSEWPEARVQENTGATAAVINRLFSRRKAAPISLFVRGTNFQIKVWEALLRIPPGHVLSYEDIAAQLGTPNATRAVASAVARNAIAVLIPCHRVIRKTGAFGEYRWGAARKQALLAWESVRSSSSRTPTEPR